MEQILAMGANEAGIVRSTRSLAEDVVRSASPETDEIGHLVVSHQATSESDSGGERS
jgi:hypothetical protein